MGLWGWWYRCLTWLQIEHNSLVVIRYFQLSKNLYKNKKGYRLYKIWLKKLLQHIIEQLICDTLLVIEKVMYGLNIFLISFFFYNNLYISYLFIIFINIFFWMFTKLYLFCVAYTLCDICSISQFKTFSCHSITKILLPMETWFLCYRFLNLFFHCFPVVSISLVFINFFILCFLT